MAKRRRILFLGLSSLLIPACAGNHSYSPPALFQLQIVTTGGAATSDASLGVGGSGGLISAVASGPITMTGSDVGPSAPATPTPSGSGTELTNAMITAGTPIAGDILVSSTLQIAAGVNPASITSSTGDVVVFGNLIAERSSGSTTNSISISAPSGTIFILGSIQSGGTPGAIDNPNGGALTLTARRIVVAGTVDTRGEAEASGSGGNGGSVTMDTTGAGGSDILFTGGIILASGGSGSTQGGMGGNVSLHAGGRLAVFAPIQTTGGAANNSASLATGGAGGNVTLAGNVEAAVVTDVLLAGGDATGAAGGAAGGAGGTFTAGSAAPCAISGSITTSGGNANCQGGTPTAGAGGPVQFGVPTPVTVLQLGQGTYSTDGGPGAQGGGAGGGLSFTSSGGEIGAAGSWSARGGDSSAGPGGAGGIVHLTTQNQPVSLTGSFSAAGGNAPAGPGGLGGQVVVNSNASGAGIGGTITVTSGSLIDVSGGNGLTGGSARNNGGPAPADSSGPNLAVVLDAAGGLGSSPDAVGGVVLNLGQIVALGGSAAGRGGDVWFDGQSAPGVELASGDSGALNLAGPAGTGTFFPN